MLLWWLLPFLFPADRSPAGCLASVVMLGTGLADAPEVLPPALPEEDHHRQP